MPKIVDKDEMRNAILDAAMRAYTERGYHAATIGDIAAQAGLGKGTLYLYFKNKDALTKALVDRHFAALEAGFAQAPRPETLDAFIGGLARTIDIPEAHAKFIRVFFEVFGPSFASDDFARTVASFFDRMGAHYAAQIDHLQKQGDVRADLDPELFGRALASQLDGVMLHRGLLSIPKARQRKLNAQALQSIKRGLSAE